MSKEPTESDKFYHELHAVIKRWLHEGDQLSAYCIIGALEAVKMDVFEMLSSHNKKQKSESENES